jgi:predicted GH43/DUF377 family glycosyl hydrolase
MLRLTVAGKMSEQSGRNVMKAERTGIVLKPDPKRVLFRPFAPHTEERALKIVARVMSLPETDVDTEVGRIFEEFHDRHLRLPEFFLKRFEQNRRYLLTDQKLSENRKLLIGAYFTSEYALESAALFNPSMIWHPEQSDVPDGSRRFIVSLRATGEGHISSLVFRSGLVNADFTIQLDPTSRFVTTPDTKPDHQYEKELFERKLLEIGLAGRFVDRVLEPLEEHFTFSLLDEQIRISVRTEKLKGNNYASVADGIRSLAESNYAVRFREGQHLWERIIFPSTRAEVKGIEDARFVEFTGDDGSRTYYATYTAYNGHVFIPQILETKDFEQFHVSTLNGPEVQNKGLALFPRKIGNRYAMISRQDNENLYIMFSDMIHFWYTKEILLKPTYDWEFVQLGNCGSPIETEAGWLVLSHGVGPMRKYSIGAFLLDLEDPTRVIGRLREPLLSPDENEREGYVPNVVYSCGGQLFGDKLIFPYAMSDSATSFATVELKPLLEELLRNGNGPKSS